MPFITTRKVSNNTHGASVAITLFSVGITCLVTNPTIAAEGDPPEISGGITLVGQQLKSQHPDQAKIGTFGSSLSVDLNFEKEVGDGKVTVYINHAEGFDPSVGTNSDYEGASGANMNEPGYDPGFTDTRVAEAKYELPVTDTLTVTFGKMSPQAYFDGNNVANDQTRQFLGAPFVNNPAIDFPGHMASHAYPGGAHASFVMSDTLTLQGAFLEDAEDFSGKFQKTFIIGEIDSAMELLDGETNVRITYFQSKANDLTGLGVSVDQTYDDDYIFFARYGARTLGATALALPDNETYLKSTMSIGAQGPFGDYTVGVGYSISNPNVIVAGKTDKETWIEVYVQYELAEGVLAALDYQQIKNPGFDADPKSYVTYSAIGGRLQVDF